MKEDLILEWELSDTCPSSIGKQKKYLANRKWPNIWSLFGERRIKLIVHLCVRGERSEKHDIENGSRLFLRRGPTLSQP